MAMMLFCLATRVSVWAASLDCWTEPTEPLISELATVCSESTIRTSGSSTSMCPSTVSRFVSETTLIWSEVTFMRVARRPICCSDSSPEVYSTRIPWLASMSATLRVRVDLPAPGAPDKRITSPSTNPPPSTRSSSLIPVTTRSTGVARILVRVCARLLGLTATEDLSPDLPDLAFSWVFISDVRCTVSSPPHWRHPPMGCFGYPRPQTVHTYLGPLLMTPILPPTHRII